MIRITREVLRKLKRMPINELDILGRVGKADAVARDTEGGSGVDSDGSRGREARAGDNRPGGEG